MGDPAFAGITDFGIADMFRRALRERSEAEHMNPVLHQACVYRAAALERELAIRNAREQARIDAEADAAAEAVPMGHLADVDPTEVSPCLLRIARRYDAVIREWITANDTPASSANKGETSAWLARVRDAEQALRAAVSGASGPRSEAEMRIDHVDGADMTRCPLEQSGGPTAASIKRLEAWANSSHDWDDEDMNTVNALIGRWRSRPAAESLDAEAGSPQPSDVQVVELLDEVQRLRSERLSAEDLAALGALRADLIDAWDSEGRTSRRSGMPPGVEVIDRLLAAHGAKP